MIPEGDELNLMMCERVSIETAASLSYRLHLASNRIYGEIDEKEALKQAIFKELNTKKGGYLIYPNYGIDISDLFGKPKEFAYIELIRRVEECLSKDDRVLSVSDFFFLHRESRKDELKISFTINSVFGSFILSNAWNFEYDWGEMSE